MRKLLRVLIISFILFQGAQAHSQPKSTHAEGTDHPKLVVGIVVDQMRWDYLYRYIEKYSSGGFKRLLNDGLSCQNTHINYLPSYTGPGHTCIYTGSVPAIHGIAGNAWFDKTILKQVNCVEDNSVSLVGTGTLKGNVSPHNLLVTTITDELKLATNNQARVVSLALKDRSAVLPGGHNPNGAYFVDGGSGNFITTSYYMKDLPPWVKNFNDKKLAQKYLAQNWNTLLPIEDYTESTSDAMSFEKQYKGEMRPVFPHNTAALGKDNPDILAYSPYGNSLTLDFAKAAIEGENLGHGKVTDFLAISLSSTDLIGHQFGPNSIEVEDCYLRLDRDLSEFLKYLDASLGKDNYLVFLTADHGAGHAIGYMNEEKIPAGSFAIDSVVKQLNDVLSQNFGPGDWILSHENMQLYLNHALLEGGDVNREDVFKVTRAFLMQYEGIADVIDYAHLNSTTMQPDIKNLLNNGYNAKRSGEFQIIYNAQWYEGFTQGATHGAVYAYDRHIPLLWMGWNIKHGEDQTDVHMTDIAPTLAALLHIQEPSGNVGKVILPVLSH